MVDTTKDLETDFCHCGRYAWRCHCPHCGSYHNYAVKQRDVVAGRLLVVHQCRRCGARFNDDDWRLRCGAPNVAFMSKAGRKTADTVATKFNSIDDVPDVMKNAMDEMLRRREGKK